MLSSLSHGLTLYLAIPGMFILGIYLTLRLRLVQITQLKESFRFLMQKGDGEGNISHFQAVATVLAGSFGTGNISGMAVAVTMGGPSALIWMWVMAFLGSATQFASCFLGMKYRQKNMAGEYVGGPMYYLSLGLGFKKTSLFFCVATLFAAFGVGNFVQVNSAALPLAQMGISPWMTGMGFALLTGLVIFGGARRIAQVSSAVVPLMAALYLIAAGVILVLFADRLGAAFHLLMTSLYSPGAAVGGLFGALVTGFSRGILATDAGTGMVPILQAEARTQHPVIDGIVALAAPFLVMVVCSVTALVLLVTGAWQEPGLESTNMVSYAFAQGLGQSLGPKIILVSLLLFGFTTTLAWASCCQRVVGYLFGLKQVRLFQIFYVGLLPLGALLPVSTAWIFADIALTAMLLANLIGVAGLSKEVIGDTQAYFKDPTRQKAAS